MTVSNTQPRRPGRPPQTDEEQARARQNIVRATEQVFAEHGYHGMSVARILELAGIARPTFYRYFRNAEEPLMIALNDAGRVLYHQIISAVADAPDSLSKVVGAIDAYLWWSGEYRHILRSLYAAMHDPSTPVSTARLQTVAAMVDLINRELVGAGRPTLERWLLDVYVNGVEYTGYQLYLSTSGSLGDLITARQIMLRTGLALLGTTDDWRRFLERPEFFPPLGPAPAS
jgi:TetR/AcrR family transcriptional regulator